MKNRIKKLVAYAKFNGIAANQKDLGNKLGYTSEQYISRLFSGNNADYSDFAEKVKKLIPEINELWLLTGVGEMLTTTANNQTGGGNTNIQGSNIHDVNSAAAIDRLIEEIKAQRQLYTELLAAKDAQIAQKDAQIDQLLKIISK